MTAIDLTHQSQLINHVLLENLSYKVEMLKNDLMADGYSKYDINLIVIGLKLGLNFQLCANEQSECMRA